METTNTKLTAEEMLIEIAAYCKLHGDDPLLINLLVDEYGDKFADRPINKITASQFFEKKYSNKLTANDSWVIRFAEEFHAAASQPAPAGEMTAEENKSFDDLLQIEFDKTRLGNSSRVEYCYEAIKRAAKQWHNSLCAASQKKGQESKE